MALSTKLSYGIKTKRKGAGMDAPCKGCKDREIGCHSLCEKYKSWRKWKDEENEKIRKAKYGS